MYLEYQILTAEPAARQYDSCKFCECIPSKAIAQLLPKALFRYDSSVRGIIYIGQRCDVDRTALAGRILKVDPELLQDVIATAKRL